MASLKEDQILQVLIGEPQESLYQLGLKDSEGYELLSRELEGLLSTPSTQLNQALKKASEGVSLFLSLSQKSFLSDLRPYAEGLGVPPHQLLSTYLIPDLINSLGRWVSPLLGCSSFIANLGGELIHLRLLDFPLNDIYEDLSRILLFKKDHKKQILSFGPKGLCYPALTAMTEEGITYALHQKFTRKINLKGHPIFPISSKILEDISDSKSVLEILQKTSTLTNWGLVLSLQKEQAVLCVDREGDEITSKKISLNPGDFYFESNFPIKSNHPNQLFPLGLRDLCEMKEKSMRFALKEANLLTHKDKLKDSTTPFDLLQVLTTPLNQKINSAKDPLYLTCSLAPTTLDAILMWPAKEKAYRLMGEAPKSFKGEYLELSHCFSNLELKWQKISSKTSDKQIQLFRNLYQAQMAYDQNQDHQFFHHLQMAKAYSEGDPLEDIVKFFQRAGELIFLEGEDQWRITLESLRDLRPRLHGILKDHAALFQMRLEILLGLPLSIQESDLSNESLQNVYRREKSLPPLAIKGLKRLVSLRLDLFDVIIPGS